MQNLNNHPVRLRLPPLHRRGIDLCRTTTTTPSGYACHPSTGGELSSAEPQQPPRQATPATPPQEGELTCAEPQQPPRQATPATPPQEGNCLVQNLNNHPVRLRLPPLHRRGIDLCRTTTTTPSDRTPIKPVGQSA